MKKQYLEIEIAIIPFNVLDVLTTSSGINEKDDSNDVMGDDPYGGF